MGLAISAVCLGVGVVFPPVGVVGAGAALAWSVVWVVTSRVRGRRAYRRAQEVVRAAQVLQSLLALGHVPQSALAVAATECPILEPVAAAVRMGGQPWDVLEELSEVPGQSGLRRIAQAWKVSEVTGGSMRDSLQTVRLGLEEAADTATVVAGELAGPRTTGQMLAALPLAGIAMAYGLGTDPLRFFVASLVGRVCLAAGVLLGCAGLMWSEALADRAGGLVTTGEVDHR
jgi:tight adherence protein B